MPLESRAFLRRAAVNEPGGETFLFEESAMPTTDHVSRFLRTVNARPEWPILVCLLALFNVHLIAGPGVAPLHFHPEPVLQGEWWRIFTHPFVHVTPYHLLVDAIGFFVVCATLQERRVIRRLLYCAGSALGSLVLALLFAAGIDSVGLCGLSGVAHGLMAVAGLEMISQGGKDRTVVRVGWITLLAVVAKGLYEAATGTVPLAGLHLGSVGTPLAACHLGGVVGGSLVYLSIVKKGTQWQRDQSRTSDNPAVLNAPSRP